MNIEAAKKIVTALAARGIEEFCLCAGARNSPLVAVLEKASGVRVFHFFEERSAAFFALGRFQNSQRPVAVVTTSGTAVAELLPATIEAHYSGWPLILLTADRPANYRGTASPQTIEQVGIFGNYVEKMVDVSAAEVVKSQNWYEDLQSWTGTRPIHLNLCMDEPLLDSPIENWTVSLGSFVENSINTESKESSTALELESLKLESPIVLVGALSKKEAKSVHAFLLRTQLPTYAESHSQLRHFSDLKNLFLKGGEKSVQNLVEQGICKSVLRLGGVPTLRLWRDLESKLTNVPVLSVVRTGFSGLARNSTVLKNFETLQMLTFASEEKEKIMKLDQQNEILLAKLCEQFPLSEQAAVRDLSKRIGSAALYLGNSLPIREWDLFADLSHFSEKVFAHRGANGIDGQLSGYLGIADSEPESWAVLGDLTTFYDLSAPWIAQQLRPGKRRLVVLNNSGGQIFNSIFRKEIFLNRHDFDFKAFADLWKWSYLKVDRIANLPSDLPDNVVIEVVPVESQSQAIWDALKK